ncbi:PIG-L deacetylase family protein [Mycolicibacterium sp.]|uniref:PIG-L deacetylase family protein n=1 Tax=Mycolicibacterium sp. TaxID=2320850 RepID=UPI0037CB0C3A
MNVAAASNVARFAAEPIAGGGTSADEWEQWQEPLPPLPLDQCPTLVVVAPHPDDEALGVGAAASALAARGVDVHTVIVSDGAAAYPGMSGSEQSRLVERRRDESLTAAAILGLPEPQFLGLPDGGLTEREAQLADILTGMLADRASGTWCAATWRGDGHPDHEAVGRAAATAVSRTGAALVEYPVWMWHWAHPGEEAVPWHRAARLTMDSVAEQRKSAAIAAFHSQLQTDVAGRDPILPAHVVARLERVGEVFFR